MKSTKMLIRPCHEDRMTRWNKCHRVLSSVWAQSAAPDVVAFFLYSLCSGWDAAAAGL